MSTSAKRRYATQAKIRAAIKAAEAAGWDVGGFDTLPDGSVRVFKKAPAPLTSAYDRWKASRQPPAN